MSDLSKVYLYRMTHIQNIPHIIVHGITHSSSANRNPRYVPIGNSSLICTRNDTSIANGHTLGDYIPFYFSYRMPMLYVIQNGYTGVEPVLTENIVYCVSSVEEVIKQKIGFIFSNGHAIDQLTTLFRGNKIDDIFNIVDFNAVHAKYWKDPNDLDKKRRKEAEFLIEADLPAKAILRFIVFNEKARNLLIEWGVNKNIVIVNPNCYF